MLRSGNLDAGQLAVAIVLFEDTAKEREALLEHTLRLANLGSIVDNQTMAGRKTCAKVCRSVLSEVSAMEKILPVR